MGMTTTSSHPLTGIDRNGNTWKLWFEGLYKAASLTKMVNSPAMSRDEAQQVLTGPSIDALYGPVAWDAAIPMEVLLERHFPVLLPREDYPGKMQQVGCACGARPKTAAERGSMMHAAYTRHSGEIGLRGDQRQAVYLSGEFQGMSWHQRIAVEKAREHAAASA
jgi:hypothetical protein